MMKQINIDLNSCLEKYFDDPRWAFFSVDLEITNHCELYCMFCPRSKITRPKGQISLEDFQKIADSLISIGSRMAFSGMGNPLANPNWDKMIEYYKKLGGKVGIVFHVGSLTQENIEKLCDVKPSFIEVSFPSLRKNVFETLVPGCDFEHSLTLLIDFLAYVRQKFAVYVIGIGTGLNFDEKCSFERFWRKYGAIARFFNCHSRGKNLSDSSLITARPSHEKICGLLSIHSFITWQKDVLACCHDLNGETKLGNLSEESWQKIAFRKFSVIRNVPHFKLCENCDEPRKKLPIPNRLFPESDKASKRFLKQWVQKVFSDNG